MVSLLNSQGMKSCKSRESFCLSILTIYTNDWSTFWHIYWSYIFSSVRFLNMCKARTGWPASIRFLWKWASKPAELAGDGECRLTQFHPIRNFFKAVPLNRLSFYLGIPLHVISSFFSHFCLFQNAILHKMSRLGFWNFKPIFLRMQFSLVATFFSLVLIISLSWYFHLTISYLTLVTWHFGSQMVFPNI